jgi:glycosyltransferase involved in cell wall biosynthesis
VATSAKPRDSLLVIGAEAIAAGLPAITSVSAGVSELVTDVVNGFVLQDPRDAQALAQIIAELYEDSPLRLTIGRAASATARQWTWEANAAAIWQLLSEAAAKKTRR